MLRCRHCAAARAAGSPALTARTQHSTCLRRMVLKKATPATQEGMDIAQKEAALSRQLKHPNIVEYYGDTIVERRKNGRKVYDVFMLMELCPGKQRCSPRRGPRASCSCSQFKAGARTLGAPRP